MQYDHTQKSLFFLVVLAPAIAMLASAFTIPATFVQVILAISGGLMLLLAMSFMHLHVSDEVEQMRVCFGPLTLFSRRFLYSDVSTVEHARTTFLEGWGIHYRGGGWTWNLSGFDCVEVCFKNGRKFRIGTDDVEGLESFLKQKIESDSETR